MLRITIPPQSLWDEKAEQFIYTNSTTLQLEHSLVSISKWESKWCKPFLSTEKKTYEETIDYIRCMTISQNIDSDIYLFIPAEVINQVNAYIEAPMTATTIYNLKKNSSRGTEKITSELIYYWMISFNIPVEFQKWHLNRLLTLIDVCNIKNSNQKMSREDTLRFQKDLNDRRKKELNTRG